MIRDYQEHGVGGIDDTAEMEQLLERIERAVDAEVIEGWRDQT